MKCSGGWGDSCDGGGPESSADRPLPARCRNIRIDRTRYRVQVLGNEVRLFVRYLRRKLFPLGVDPVETVRGVGYRYAPRRV